MSITKQKSTITIRALQALFDRGAGRGTGPHFLPWQTTATTNSKGRSLKYHCPVTGRTRHLLSVGEERLIYGALRDSELEDARENYALPIGLTEPITIFLGISHISSTAHGRPLLPYTIDLLLTRRRPPKYIALSWRQRKALREPKDNNALLVEHVACTLLEVPWYCATDLEVSEEAMLSMRVLRPEVQRAQRDLRKQPTVDAFYQAALEADWSGTALEVVRSISASVGVDSEKGWRIFCDLVWAGELPCDLERAVHADLRNAIQVPRGYGR